jgi:hypothetical protein
MPATKNFSTYHHQPSQHHQLGDVDDRRNGSGARASAKALDVGKNARITVSDVMQALRLRSVSALSEVKDAAAAAREDSNMQIFRIPTQSVKDQPGPTLNPASCASGLNLLGGDWISNASLERMNEGQGKRRHPQAQSSSNQNEDWGDFHLSLGNQFLCGDD